jgi:hypothetical protein
VILQHNRRRFERGVVFKGGHRATLTAESRWAMLSDLINASLATFSEKLREARRGASSGTPHGQDAARTTQFDSSTPSLTVLIFLRLSSTASRRRQRVDPAKSSDPSKLYIYGYLNRVRSRPSAESAPF